MKFLLTFLLLLNAHAIEVKSTACSDGDMVSTMVCKNKNSIPLDAAGILKLSEIKEQVPKIDQLIMETLKLIKKEVSPICTFETKENAGGQKYSIPKRTKKFNQSNDAEVFKQLEENNQIVADFYKSIQKLYTESNGAKEVLYQMNLMNVKYYLFYQNQLDLFERANICHNLFIDPTYHTTIKYLKGGNFESEQKFYEAVQIFEKLYGDNGNGSLTGDAANVLAKAYGGFKNKVGMSIPEDKMDIEKMQKYFIEAGDRGHCQAMAAMAALNHSHGLFKKKDNDDFHLKTYLVLGLRKGVEREKYYQYITKLRDSPLKRTVIENNYFQEELEQFEWLLVP
jgi:hypothetical protein